MILISSLLFLAGQFSATLAANELNASNHLKKLEEVFLRFDRQNREFLLNENTVKAVEAIIDHFAGGLIAAAGMEPDIDGLPEEERLNF